MILLNEYEYINGIYIFIHAHKYIYNIYYIDCIKEMYSKLHSMYVFYHVFSSLRTFLGDSFFSDS